MMFIDYTAPRHSIGDVVKVKGKAKPFKIVDIMEDEDGTILYLVRQVQEYIINSEQITKTIQYK